MVSLHQIGMLLWRRSQSQRGMCVQFAQSFKTSKTSTLSNFRSAFDLLRPFGIYLWLCILASIITVPVTFMALGRLDGMVRKKLDNHRNYGNNWTSSTDVLWYSYGTLMGENVSSIQSQQLTFTLK